MSFEDERIVKMTFDSKAFEKNIESTIRCLQRLEKTMKLEDASPEKTFETFTDGVNETNEAMTGFDETVNKVKTSFSALQIIGYTALSELTRYAMNFGKQIYNSTLGQIKSGGMARALNIESAKFQIEGLGHTWADVEEDISYGVKDTAYGLDSAAKAASQLLASQISSGDQMKTALRGISGVAAMTNSTYDEIADIFTTVAGNGRLMGDQLNRLSYRGLNAAADLAKYFNAVNQTSEYTEASIRDMVSKGKISFQEFAAAMDSAFGDHAKDANKTFTGAMSNMRAALSRIGEKFISPFDEVERRLAVAIIPLINEVNKSLDYILPTFKYIIDAVAEWTEKLAGNVKFQHAIANVAAAIQQLIQNIIGALWELGFATPNVYDLAESFDKLTGKLIMNEEQSRALREVIKTIVKSFSILINIINGLLYAIEPLYKPVINWLKSININVQGATNKSQDVIDKINTIVKIIAILMRIGIEKSIKAVGIAIQFVKGTIIATIAIIAGIGKVISKVIEWLKYCGEVALKWGKAIINILSNIGKAFASLYLFIKDLLSRFTDGIMGFLEEAKVRTAALWAIVSDMFEKRTLSMTVDIDANVKQIRTSDLIQNEASAAVNTAKGAMLDFGDSTAVASKGMDKFAATGGKYLKGAMGGTKRGLINTDAIRQQAEALQGMSGTVEQVAQSTEKSADRITKSTEKMTSAVNGSFSDGMLFNRKKAEEALDEADEGITGSVIEKMESIGDTLSKAAHRVAEHFSNFFAVITDVIVVSSSALTVVVTAIVYKIIGSLINALDLIPDLLSSLTNAAKGFKYQGMGEMFKGLGITILAIGALIATIAVVAKFVDPDALGKVAKIVTPLMLAIAAIAFAASAFSAMSALFGALDIAKKLTNTKTMLEKLNMFAGSMERMLLGLAACVAVVIAGIFLFEREAERLGGYDRLKKAALLVGAIFAGITLFVAIASKIIGSKSIMQSIDTFDIKTKVFTRSTTNGFGALTVLLTSMIPLILTVMAAIYLLAQPKTDLKRAGIAIGLIFGSLAIFFGMALTSVKVLTNAAKGASGKLMDAAVITKLIANFRNLILSMVGLMLGIVASAALISMIPEDKQEFVFKMIITEMASITAIVLGLLGMAVVMQKIAASSGRGIAALTHISALLTAVSSNIMSLAIAIAIISVSLSVSLGIISMIPEDKLGSSVTALVVMVGAVLGFITVLMLTMKNVTKTMSSSSLITASSTSVFDKFGVQIQMLMGGLAGLLLTITSSLIVLGHIDPDKLLAAAVTLTVIMGALLGFMAVLLALLKSVETSTESLNHIGKNKNARTNTKTITQITGYMDNVGTMMMQLMASMSIMVVAMTAAIRILGPMNINDLIAGTAVLLIAMGAMVGGAIALMTFMTKLSHEISKANFTKERFKFIHELTGMMLLLGATVAGLMAAISGMVLLFDQSSASSIWLAIGTFVVALGGIMSSIFVLYKISKTITPGEVQKIRDIFLASTQLFVGLAPLIASIGIAAFLMGKSSPEALDTLSSMLGKILFTVGLMEAFVVIAAKFGNETKGDLAALYALSGVIGAMSILVLAMAGLSLVFKDMDIENIDRAINAMIVVFAGLAVLIAVIGLVGSGIGVASKGLIFISGLITTIALAALAISYATTMVVETFKDVISSLNQMATLTWEPIQAAAQSLKQTIAILASAMDIDFASLANAFILGVAIKAMMSGLAILQNINPVALVATVQGLKGVFEELNMLQDYVTVAAITIALLGPLLAGGLVVVMLGIVASLGLAYIAVMLAGAVVAKAAQIVDSFTANLDKISKSIMAFASSIDDNELNKALVTVGHLVYLGFEMLAAGIMLAVGVVAFIVGAVLLPVAVEILNIATAGLGDDLILKLDKSMDALTVIMGLAIYLLASGLLLGISVSVMLPTAALLWLTVFLLCKSMENADALAKGADAMREAVTRLGGFALLLVPVAAMLAISGVLLGIACLGLMGGVIVLASVLALIYFVSVAFEWDTMMTGIEKILTVIGVFTLVAIGILYLSVPLIIAAAAMMVISILLSVTGVALFIAAASFGLGLLALYGACTIVDFDVLNEGLLKMMLAGALLFGVGTIMFVAMVPFIIASALFAVAAVLFSVGIITFTLSLVVGGALLLAAAAILEQSFIQLERAFSEFSNMSNQMSEVFNLLGFAVVLVVIGALLTVGGVLLTVGSTLVLVGALIMTTAFTAISKSFTKSINVKDLVSKTGDFLLAMGVLAGAALVGQGAAIMLIAFGGSLMVGATMIATGIEQLVAAAEGIQKVVDGFKNAGNMVIDGFVEGINEDVGKAQKAIEDLAQGNVLDAFCDILGIHSPAEEFIKAAANCIAGFVEGIGGNKEKAYDTVYKFGMGIVDKFEGVVDGFKSVGSESGDGFMDKLTDVINGRLPDLGNSILGSFGDILGGLNSMGIDAQISALESEIKNKEMLAGETDNEMQVKELLSQANDLRERVKDLKAQKDAFEIKVPEVDYNLPSTSTGLGGDTSGLSPETQEALSEAGKGIGSGGSSAAKSVGGNVGTSITNNTYNFVQNNYSPEPIDRTELYNQTNNQLQSWYAWLKTT